MLLYCKLLAVFLYLTFPFQIVFFSFFLPRMRCLLCIVAIAVADAAALHIYVVSLLHLHFISRHLRFYGKNFKWVKLWTWKSILIRDCKTFKKRRVFLSRSSSLLLLLLLRCWVATKCRNMKRTVTETKNREKQIETIKGKGRERKKNEWNFERFRCYVSLIIYVLNFGLAAARV